MPNTRKIQKIKSPCGLPVKNKFPDLDYRPRCASRILFIDICIVHEPGRIYSNDILQGGIYIDLSAKVAGGMR